MIQRYSGTRGPATSLTRLMNSLMADPFFSAVTSDGGAVGGSAVNVYEQDDNLIVEAEMPGFEPDDIDISIERGMLTIRGEMEDEDERQDRNYLVREYRRGTFVRSVRLPDTIDTEKVEANFDNGVLRLVFPKAEQARARRISVGEGSASQDGSRRRRRSNGHAGNGSTDAAGRTQGDGSTMTEAQHADARSGRQSQQPAGAASGSQSGQSSTAGSSTNR